MTCSGYSLRDRWGSLRDGVLLGLRAPVLSIQGTRDPWCPPNLLEGMRAGMHTRNATCIVNEGDHSLRASAVALRMGGATRVQVEDTVVRSVGEFIASTP
jgi:uncharacterized protein